MAHPPQVSRSFPLLTLLLAIPLIAIVAYVAYDRYIQDEGDGWKTYRNDRYGYELRYPPDWQVIEESDYPAGSSNENIDIQHVIFARDKADPSRPGVRPLPRVFAAVNFQGGWCESSRTERREITVSGVPGTETACYAMGGFADECEPKPQCVHEPSTLLWRFQKDGRRYTIWGDNNPGRAPWFTDTPPVDPDAAGTTQKLRKLLDSYRFTR